MAGIKGKSTRPIKIVNDLPTTTREIRLSELQRLASLGFTLSQIALIMKVSDRALWNKIEEYPEVKHAWDTGRLEGLSKIAKSAFDAAMEGDTTMIIFLCKVRLGWSEKREEETDKAQVHIYLPESLSEEQWNHERNRNSKTLPAETNDD